MDIFSYKIINQVFFILLLFGFLWLLSIKIDIIQQPQCQYKAVTGVDCPTCGMTRDFSSIIDISNKTIFFNQNSIYYFIFFLYLGISRLVIIILNLIKKTNKVIILADIITTILLFLVLIIIPFVKN